MLFVAPIIIRESMTNCKSPTSWISIAQRWCLPEAELHYLVGGGHGPKFWKKKKKYLSLKKFFFFFNLFGFGLLKIMNFFSSKGKKC